MSANFENSAFTVRAPEGTVFPDFSGSGALSEDQFPLIASPYESSVAGNLASKTAGVAVRSGAVVGATYGAGKLLLSRPGKTLLLNAGKYALKQGARAGARAGLSYVAGTVARKGMIAGAARLAALAGVTVIGGPTIVAIPLALIADYMFDSVVDWVLKGSGGNPVPQISQAGAEDLARQILFSQVTNPILDLADPAGFALKPLRTLMDLTEVVADFNTDFDERAVPSTRLKTGVPLPASEYDVRPTLYGGYPRWKRSTSKKNWHWTQNWLNTFWETSFSQQGRMIKALRLDLNTVVPVSDRTLPWCAIFATRLANTAFGNVTTTWSSTDLWKRCSPVRFRDLDAINRPVFCFHSGSEFKVSTQAFHTSLVLGARAGTKPGSVLLLTLDGNYGVRDSSGLRHSTMALGLVEVITDANGCLGNVGTLP
jgi:hypothetical protein